MTDASPDPRLPDSEDIEKHGPEKLLNDVDGILVAPGFGARGTEGKIAAIRHAREKKVPFFGICFGMQLAVVEFARDVCVPRRCVIFGAGSGHAAPGGGSHAGSARHHR